jgi:GNAT superfamily N-acetyltransferase
VADDGAHGRSRYRRHVVDIRSARPDELALLPPLEAAADTLFDALGIGPMPGPCDVTDLEGALVVLVAGDPPQGFARVEALAGGAHLEQLSVHPDHVRRGVGRALLRAAVAWVARHGYDALTLATYRDVPWNGPFYASEGFVELGPADDWYAARGLPPEEPVMGRFGARVLMARRLP